MPALLRTPVLIRTTAELLEHLPALMAAPEIALDTEFHPEKAYTPKLMLLQLSAAGGGALVVDPLGEIDLTCLAPILSVKPLLVHGGAQDLALLRRYVGATPCRVFDTQIAAGFAGFGYPRRLQDLVAALDGPRLEKGETLSDWSRRPLSPDQLKYAADDVLVLPQLAQELRLRAAAQGNTSFLDAALAESLAAAVAPPDDSRCWRRFVGAHLLADAERAALQGLAAWREGRARELNTPTGHLVADAVLFDLARRRPESIERLRDNRRMPSQVWRQYGEELLRVLRSAVAATPPSGLPRGARADAVRLAARIVAEGRGIAGELLLPESELDYILAEISTTSWRRQALGGAFDDFLAGSRLISVAGTLVPAPIG